MKVPVTSRPVDFDLTLAPQRRVLAGETVDRYVWK